jgi:hypothetical protein
LHKFFTISQHGGTIDDYKIARMQELQNQQRAFCKEYVCTTEDTQHAQNAVVLMELGLSVGGAVVLLNQQQMFQKGDYIHSITPLANTVMVNYWQESLPLAIITKSRHVFLHPEAYKRAERGYALEGLILNTFKRNASFQIPLQQLTSSKLVDKNYVLEWTLLIPLKIPGYRICYYPTNNPPPSKFFEKEIIIFIPYNSNYPDLDFVIWDGIKRVLWAFQITIENPISKHSNNIHVVKDNEAVSHSSKWCTNCNISSDFFRFCWIGTNRDVESDPNPYVGHYFSTLDDVNWIGDFSVLREWVDKS